MRKTLIKIAVCIMVFFVSILVSMNIMNQRNTDMTAEMAQASFPLVHIENSGIAYNTLHGLKQEIDTTFWREPITPLEADRKLSFVVEKFGNEITGLSFEVRNLDGSRLIEQTEITYYREMEHVISATVSIKDLIEKNQEYNWILKVSTPQGVIRYYTRIVDAEDYHVYDKLSFVTYFHEATFDKETCKELAKYMETNSRGDNTSLHYVDIHSSLNQLSWADLTVNQLTESDILISEIDEKTASVIQNYVVETREGKKRYQYLVSEYYQIRYTRDRIYLLNFERTMDQIFNPHSDVYASNKIMLGIRNQQVHMAESEGGNNLAFVNQGQLFCYHATDKKMAYIFSFYDDLDLRSLYPNHGIRIFHVDETGNVSFMVYGYMNRGMHEGEMGIQVYEYNGMLNHIEERVFIPYDKSFATLQTDLQALAYLNKSESLFLYLDGTIFSVNLADETYTEIASGLQAGTFQVSDDNEMLVWQNAENVVDCTKLILMNLNSGRQKEISTTKENRIKPLGFIQDDLIYGIAHVEDIEEDVSGVMTFPMYAVYIQNEQGDILKSYEPTEIYVTDCTIEENLISLTRMKKEDGEYVETTNDQIVNNLKEEKGVNQVEVVTTQNYEKIVQLVLKGEVESRNLKISEPKEIMYEGSRVLPLINQNPIEKYYVYRKNTILGTFANASDAINLAYENNGTVIDEQGAYIWKKTARNTRNQIMKITGAKKQEEKSNLAVCLETVMSYYGFVADAQNLLNHNHSATQILSDHLLEQKVIDLEHVELDAALYYVNLDIPVIALLGNEKAMLITGFNESNLVVLKPETGELSKISMSEAKNLCRQNGNRFLVAMPYGAND